MNDNQAVVLTYKSIVEVLQRNIDEAKKQPFQLTQVQRIEIMIADFVKLFEQKDPNFDRDKFLDAIHY